MARAEAGTGERRFPSSLEAAHRRTRIPFTNVKVPLLGRLSLSSPSTRLVSMEWTTVDADPDGIVWAEVPGNPRSHSRPHGWSFSVLGMEMDAMFDVMGKDRVVSAAQAVVCEDAGEVKVGMNPDQDGHLFGGRTVEGTNLFLAAIRHGGDDLRATMAYVIGEEMYVPDQSPVVLAQHLPSGVTDALDRYPRAMLAG